MATTYQNPPRPKGQSTIRKSQTTKTPSKQLPSKITNNSKEIKIRFGNNTSQNSMSKPSLRLKKKPFERPYTDDLNDTLMDGRRPSDLETIKPRYYSPIHTPPRLRTLITPPGLEPYRNHQDLRRLNSPLLGFRDRYSPPVGFDAWGLNPTDHHLHSNLNLIRRYPSPLSNYGLGSALPRQKKSYVVVPRLTDYVSPPVSRGDANFILPSHRLSSVYVPDSRHTSLKRVHSFPLLQFHREPSDYVYIRQNEAFANRYIDDFIGRYIKDQLIPDILLEIIAELDQENKKRGGKSQKTKVDRYYAELNQRIHQEETNNTRLFADDWMHELDQQRPRIPATNTSSLRQLDVKEIPPIRPTSRVRYHDLPADVQGRLLADINHELIDFETQNMMQELSSQTLANRVHHVPMINDTRRDIHHDIQSETVMHDTGYNLHTSQRQQHDQAQHNSVEKYVQNKLLDTTCLNQLIIRHIKQNGSVVDFDDLSRLLDANILENLISQHQYIDENRSRTLDNYASKKFHLNTYMNVTMDFLLSELSASLIEDMKDLDEQERRIFF